VFGCQYRLERLVCETTYLSHAGEEASARLIASAGAKALK